MMTKTRVIVAKRQNLAKIEAIIPPQYRNRLKVNIVMKRKKFQSLNITINKADVLMMVSDKENKKINKLISS